MRDCAEFNASDEIRDLTRATQWDTGVANGAAADDLRRFFQVKAYQSRRLHSRSPARAAATVDPGGSAASRSEILHDEYRLCTSVCILLSVR